MAHNVIDKWPTKTSQLVLVGENNQSQMTEDNETAGSSLNRIWGNKAAVILLEIQIVAGYKPFMLIQNISFR